MMYARWNSMTLALVLFMVVATMTTGVAEAQSLRLYLNEGYGLKAELTLDKRDLAYFEPETYWLEDDEGQTVIKIGNRETSIPMVLFDLYVNGNHMGTIRFTVEDRDSRNSGLGEVLDDARVWVNATPIYDITTFVKRPGWLSSSESNRVDICNIQLYDFQMRHGCLEAMYEDQTRREAEARRQGQPAIRFGTEFIRITLYRDGQPMATQQVLIKVASIDGSTASLEYLNTGFSFQVTK